MFSLGSNPAFAVAKADIDMQENLHVSCMKNETSHDPIAEGYCDCIVEEVVENSDITSSTKENLINEFTTDLNEAMGVSADEFLPEHGPEMNALGQAFNGCLMKLMRGEFGG